MAFLVFSQLMLDYHIGAASIARSLASYVVTVLELIPFLKDNIPSWVGHGEEVFGALSINILAPILLVLLTVVLCRGVGESSMLNSIMTVTKVFYTSKTLPKGDSGRGNLIGLLVVIICGNRIAFCLFAIVSLHLFTVYRTYYQM